MEMYPEGDTKAPSNKNFLLATANTLFGVIS